MPFPLRTLPNNTRNTLERSKLFARIGPFAQFVDSDMITRLPPSSMIEQRARNIDHVRRVHALVEERSATASAEAARGVCRFVLVSSYPARALGDTEALPPAPYIAAV